MKNLDIRKQILNKKVHYWEVAERCGIHESTLSRMLRRELPDDKKQRILQIIEDIEREGNGRG